jgi:two-component system cell cycle response regulator
MRDNLQIENLTLRHQLESLLQEARQNEDKLRRFDVLERRIIGAGSFVELIQLLLADYRKVFGIEHVSLTLVDQEYEIPRLLDEAGLGQEIPGLCLMPDDEWLTFCFSGDYKTRLTRFDSVSHGRLFPDGDEMPASVALLPLMRQNCLIGSLNLGSADLDRYTEGAGTEFLDRLAAVAAVCVESTLSRERLKRAGVTDALTGVHNRRYFDHRCPAETSQARRQRQPLACMFLDIDRFKRINDTYGHQVGDLVLQGIATTIKAQLRTSDTLARYGGEEFVALLPQTAQTHALEIAERIRAAIEAQVLTTPHGERVPVTISIGLSMAVLDSVCEHKDAATAMVAAADHALYEAKHGGRNRVVSATALPFGCKSSPLQSIWTQARHLVGGALHKLATLAHLQRA